MFKEDGFTIIEMIVVIGILSVLTSFVFINHRSTEAVLSFEREVGNLLEGIRKTRNHAIASWYPEEGFLKDHLDQGNVFHRGYGIRFEKNSGDYILFADLDDDKKFDDSVDVVLEERRMEKGTEVKSIKINGEEKNFLDVVYRPPDLFIFFNMDNATEKDITAVITLSSVEGGHEKEVKINPYGVPMYEQ